VKALRATVLCLDKPPGLRFEVIRRAREAFRRLRPDVVHTHQIGALLYAGPAARRERVPLVVHTEHSNHVANQTGLIRRARIRALWGLAGRYATRFFCVSADIAEAVTAYGVVPRSKTGVVPNGIDTASFEMGGDTPSLRRDLGIPDNAKVVGTVGRLAEVKRQDLLVRALPRVSDAHLLLVGDGPEMPALRQLVAELGLTDHVHFAGYQSRPQHFLHLMDVFALPSRLEGMPLAILEAWASSLPVAATRVGGVPKMVEHGTNGLLVEPGDERALADAIASLLAEPDRAQRLGAAGRDLVSARFDTKATTDCYEGHYRDALRRPLSIGSL
jgi:glycosyltransferase involved in cell wall biosynthesis